MNDLIAALFLGIMVYSFYVIREQVKHRASQGATIDSGNLPYLLFFLESGSSIFNFLLGYNLANSFFDSFIAGIIAGLFLGGINFSYPWLAKMIVGVKRHKQAGVLALISFTGIVAVFFVSQMAFSTHAEALFKQSNNNVKADQAELIAIEKRGTASQAHYQLLAEKARAEGNTLLARQHESKALQAEGWVAGETANNLRNASSNYEWKTMGMAVSIASAALMFSIAIELIIVTLSFYQALFVYPSVMSGIMTMVNKNIDFSASSFFKGFRTHSNYVTAGVGFGHMESEPLTYEKTAQPSSGSVKKPAEKAAPTPAEKAQKSPTPETSKEAFFEDDGITYSEQKDGKFYIIRMYSPAKKLLWAHKFPEQMEMQEWFDLNPQSPITTGYFKALDIAKETKNPQEKTSVQPKINLDSTSGQPVNSLKIQNDSDSGAIAGRTQVDSGAINPDFSLVAQADEVEAKKEALYQVIKTHASHPQNNNAKFPKTAAKGKGLGDDGITEVYAKCVREGLLKTGKPYRIIAQ